VAKKPAATPQPEIETSTRFSFEPYQIHHCLPCTYGQTIAPLQQASQSPQLSISSPSLSLNILAVALALALADLAARAVLAVLAVLCCFRCPCYPRCPCSSECPHYTCLHCAGLLLLLLCRQSAYFPLPGACVYKRALLSAMFSFDPPFGAYSDGAHGLADAQPQHGTPNPELFKHAVCCATNFSDRASMYAELCVQVWSILSMCC
jgi:hypothetical protein